MNDTSTAEMLAAVMWLVRDVMVPLALFLAILGLFSRRDWVNATMVWVLGLLGTLVTLSDSSKKGLFGIPTGVAVLGVVLTAALLVIGWRRQRPIFKNRGRLQVAPARSSGSSSNQSPVGRKRKASQEKGSTSIKQAKTVSETPQCPKCGSPMVLRVAKSGPNAGKQFYGCSNYPQCRGTRTIE